MKQISSLILLLLAACVSAMAQDNGPSLNMTLFGQLNPVDSVGAHAALWGYTAPNGREYALFGSQIGTHIIDITEKPIREVAYIWGPRSGWREMKVYKNYAYIISESPDPGRGLQIVDLSGLPAAATLVRTDTTHFTRAHTIYIRDRYMYVMGTSAEAGANGGAIIFDLEPDPLHPRRVGMVNPYYYHDAWERGDTLLGAAINGQGCDIYDVRDKANPQHLATITYPYSGTHNAEITSDGGYVLTTDEVNFTPKTLKVWDIRDLNNIRKVTEYTPNMSDVVHNVHVRGRYALVAWYTAGVRIIDMIDPTHPREVAYYDTYPGPSGGYSGVWEVYGFFPSGKVIASDRQTGLYVFGFNNATAGSVSGIVRNKITGDPLPGVTVRVTETGATVVSDANGRYYVGGVNGTKLTITTQEFIYAATSEEVTLAGDVERDIMLTPLELHVATLIVRDEVGRPIEGFAYAIEPHIHSTAVGGSSTTLLLPHDQLFTLTVGKWGYAIERLTMKVRENNEEIVATLYQHYEDDATLNLGWSFQAPDDNATSGRWTRMTAFPPFAESDWIYPPAQPPGGFENYVFQTGMPPFDTPPQFTDVNGGHTTLISPRTDLLGFVPSKLDFDLWFVHYKADSVIDTLLLQVSNDDGDTWQTLYSEVEGRNGWRRLSIDITGIPYTERMRFRFRVSDTLSRALVVAAVDNVQIIGHPSSVPPDDRSASTFLTMEVEPNPMRGSGALTVNVATPVGDLRIELYNSLGESVALLHDGALEAGAHRFTLGAGLPAGSYRVWASDRRGHGWSRGVVVVR